MPKSKRRKAAAKKGAATRKSNAAKRRRAARKAACAPRKGKGGRSRCKTRKTKTVRRARRTARKATKRKSSKRVAAGRKAARTRARNRKKIINYDYPAGYTPAYEGKRRRRRRKSRKASEAGAAAAAPRRRRRRRHAVAAAAPRRRRRRHMSHAAAPRRRRRSHRRRHSAARKRRHHVRAMNPIHGAGEFAAAIGGILVGSTLTILGDRYGAGHALTGTAPSLVDQPAAGQLYNANAALAPIWSSWKRLVIAGANLVLPLGASMALKKHPKTQTFFQTYFFAALTVTGGKLVLDVLPKMLGTKAIGARLLAPEIDAQNARTSVQSSNTALPGYTLVAGGTGPAPVSAASGSNMLGAVSPGSPICVDNPNYPGCQPSVPVNSGPFNPMPVTPAGNPAPSSGPFNPMPVTSSPNAPCSPASAASRENGPDVGDCGVEDPEWDRWKYLREADAAAQ